MADLVHNLALGFGVAFSPINLMLCLIGDAALHVLEIRTVHGKRAVAGLPDETAFAQLLTHPF